MRASTATAARARARGNVAPSTRRAEATRARAVSRREGVLLATMLSVSLAGRRRATAAEEDEDGATTTTTTETKKRVVITGSNSGIGLDAATKLAASGDWVVVLACRTRAKAEAAKANILSATNADGANIECVECDLSSLDSVRAFAREVRKTGGVDALCLNAGVEYSGDPVVHRTRDGFEETFGVNHLGHFLLANLLLEDLEKSSEAHPRIVVTASEVHDPASPGGSVGSGAHIGDLRGLERDGAAFEMADGEAFDADKAYKDSKLANMLFMYELERRLQARNSKITVNAFGPGLITRTGLFRNQNPLFVKVFDFATNEIFHVAETVSGGGNCLVFMLTDPSLEGSGGVYWNNDLSPGAPPSLVAAGHKFAQTNSSVESNDAVEAQKLWKLSESLVGLA